MIWSRVCWLKNLVPAEGRCLQVAMNTPQGSKLGQACWKFLSHICFFCFVILSFFAFQFCNILLGKTYLNIWGGLHLSCNVDSNPSWPASQLLIQTHKPANGTSFFIHEMFEELDLFKNQLGVPWCWGDCRAHGLMQIQRCRSHTPWQIQSYKYRVANTELQIQHCKYRANTEVQVTHTLAAEYSTVLWWQQENIWKTWVLFPLRIGLSVGSGTS